MFTWCNLPFTSKVRSGVSFSGGITSYDLNSQRENFSTSPTYTVISMHWLICVFVSVTCFLCSHFSILFHLSQYHLEMSQTLQGSVPCLWFWLWCVVVGVFFKQILVMAIKSALCTTYFTWGRQLSAVQNLFLQIIFTLKLMVVVPAAFNDSPSLLEILLDAWVMSKRKYINTSSGVEPCFLTFILLEIKVDKSWNHHEI